MEARCVFVVMAAFLCAACSSVRRSPRRGLEMDAGACEHLEGGATRFEMLSDLRDNPIDPLHADMDELLSIPGFPPNLAERVVLTRRARRGRGDWTHNLSPPEREALYGFCEYLSLPDREPLRAGAVMRIEGPGTDGTTGRDMSLSAAGEGWRASARRRDRRSADLLSFYASKRLCSGAVTLHAGDFVPDLALGVVCRGYSGTYPFSSGYPIGNPRWLIGRTGFYGVKLRGAACEIWVRRARFLLFSARTVESPAVRADCRGSCFRGGRVELGIRDLTAGVTFAGSDRRCSGGTVSVDGRLSRGAVTCACEFAADRRYRPGGAWGVRYGPGPVEAGLLVYVFPFGLRSGLGGIAGRTLRPGSSQSGFVLSFRRSLLKGLMVRTACERSVLDDGFDRSRSTGWRVELHARWRKVRIAGSWSTRNRMRDAVIPFPPAAAGTCERTRRFRLRCMWKWCGLLNIRGELSIPGGDSGGGCLASPSAETRLLSGRLRLRAGTSLFLTHGGSPVFYCYEPGFPGMYSWKSVRGTGWRCWAAVGVAAGRFRLYCRIALDSADRRVLGVQAAYKM